MSYLICKKCGKHYLLEEGKSSFNFERCECGGKLGYSTTLNRNSPLHQSKKTNTSSNEIKWKGVLLGFLFLFFSLIVAVIALFGTDLPTNASAITFQDLTVFSIITVVLAIVSGFLSSYLSGSGKFRGGALNGGLVGVILGLILGMFGGLLVLISAIAVFGSLSMIGGIISSLLRK